MKSASIFSVIGILLLLAPMTTIQAQEPGSDGMIVTGGMGGAESSIALMLNPLIEGASGVTYWMFPTLIGVSPFTQYYARAGDEGVTNALATDWTISDDGLTYTFTLRRDAVWSDGTPITTRDIQFIYEAVNSGEFPWYIVEGIRKATALDDYTYQIVYEEPTCEALQNMRLWLVIPSHVFGYDGRPDFDFSIINGHPFNTNPSVVFGPFQLDYVHVGKEFALKAVPAWSDGPVIPKGIILRDIIDPEDSTARFLSGEFDYIQNPGPCMTCYAAIRAAPDVTAVSFVGSRWDYIGLNLADPENPQPGLDSDGNLIDQGHHPLFGDVRVRRALQLAINVQTIIEEAALGEGTPMASALIPGSWAADPTLEPVPYDPALAAQILDEVGWPLGPDGVRVCQGCKYALDGTRFEFELLTNAGNTRRETTGMIVRDQLAQLGIVVALRLIDFDELMNIMDAETFDAILLGWSLPVPYEPGLLYFFGPGADVTPDISENFTSYYNPDVVRLSQKVLTVPGCDAAARAEIYHQIERLMQADQPYLWLYAQNELYAAHNYVIGFDPKPVAPFWNIHTWRVERP